MLAKGIAAMSGIMLSFAPFQPEYLRTTLDEAVASHLISVQAVSLGGYVGEVVELVVQNPGRKAMQITVPIGTAFYPEDSKDQTLILGGEQRLALNGRPEQRFTLSAFCTEASDLSPQEGGHFVIQPYQAGAIQARKLDSLFDFVQQTPSVMNDPFALQSAVWAITDSSGVSSIYNDDLSSIKALRDFVCQLLKVEDVWYNTDLDLALNEHRQIVSETMRVNGFLRMTNEARTTLHGRIEDNEGGVIWDFERDTQLPAGTVKFRFELEVTGWEAGEYFVVYSNAKSEVLRQGFRVG